jgi:hypothetical protein
VRPGDAVMKLTALGYRFELEGVKVRWRWEGLGTPDPGKVRPLLKVVKAHKGEVHFFLHCYCQKCGGIVFVGDECFLCDWVPQVRQQPLEPERGEKMNICGDCGHFLPSQLNPLQGFGRCALESLSKQPGAYPSRTACHHFEMVVGDGTLRLAQ